MSNELIAKILKAFVDVEKRLAIGPPGFSPCQLNATKEELLYEKAELSSKFFDGMLCFDVSDFPDMVQQYIVAFSYIPVAAFYSSPPHVTNARSLHATRIARDGSDNVELFYFDGIGDSLIEPLLENPEALSTVDYRPLKRTKDQLSGDYTALLNKLQVNRLEVPEKFTSLQIWSFFKKRWDVYTAVIDSATKVMDETANEIVKIPDEQKTRDHVLGWFSQKTGLPIDSKAAPILLANWGLLQRLGIYASEEDQALAEAFLEVVRDFGHMDARSVNNAMDKLCFDRGIKGIKTPASVRFVMERVLGYYYHELTIELKQKREVVSSSPVKAIPVNPDKIQPVDTRHSDVRQLIEGETLGTGERDGSSLRHGTLYNFPKTPTGQRRLKKDNREPT